MSGIKISFLGTNGWFDSETGETVCILIETPKEYIVLDAGNALRKLDRHIKTEKPIFLFISHFHLDHINGLHVLAKFRFKQGLNICIQKGRRGDLNEYMDRKYTMPLSRLKTKVKIHELDGRGRIKGFPALEKALLLHHPVPSFGFRLKLNGKIVAYIADTGVCPNAFALAKSADILITECAFKPGQKAAEWPHLNPESAAEIAKISNAKKLVLVHFDAELYKTLAERQKAKKIAKKIFRKTTASVDGLVVNG